MMDNNGDRKSAANMFRLQISALEEEVVTDLSNKKWKLGKSIGRGSFGQIYLASENTCKTVSNDASHVIKIEPHSNGPLFVEIHFYIRAAKREMILSWKEKKNLKFLGLPCYIASGSHEYQQTKYRFLVINRYGQNIENVFLDSGRKLHIQTVLYLGIQILNVLEYVHSKDYVHADIKGSNLLLGDKPERVFLVDFGLACRYRKPNGEHKEYVHDERRAHGGTPEYTSRDAHIGAYSRRGDLEILGYNMLQWLCSVLPWEDKLSDMEYVCSNKTLYMSNIPALMVKCFPNVSPPAAIEKYLKYVSSLEFETEPDYNYCIELFKQGMRNENFENNGKLLFGLTPVNKCSDSMNFPNALHLSKSRISHKTKSHVKKRLFIHLQEMIDNSFPSRGLRSQRTIGLGRIKVFDPERLARKRGNPYGSKGNLKACMLSHRDNSCNDCCKKDQRRSQMTKLGQTSSALLVVRSQRIIDWRRLILYDPERLLRMQNAAGENCNRKVSELTCLDGEHIDETTNDLKVCREVSVDSQIRRMSCNPSPSRILRSQQVIDQKELPSLDPERLFRERMSVITRESNQKSSPCIKLKRVRESFTESCQRHLLDRQEFSSLNNPTPAMLQVMKKKEDSSSGELRKKWKRDSLQASPRDSLTPAMKEVIVKSKI